MRTPNSVKFQVNIYSNMKDGHFIEITKLKVSSLIVSIIKFVSYILLLFNYRETVLNSKVFTLKLSQQLKLKNYLMSVIVSIMTI